LDCPPEDGTGEHCTVSCSGYGVCSVTYNANPYVITGDNNVTYWTSEQIYHVGLLAVYENESMEKLQYWVKEGHEKPDTAPYHVYFNETGNTGPIDTGNISTVEYYSYGYPYCPGAAGWPDLNGNYIGSPNITKNNQYANVFYGWTDIPPAYIDAPDNCFLYSTLGNDRMMVPVLGIHYYDDLEFGDAPDPTYPSLLASDGARHFPTDTEWLGLQSTGEWKDYELDANVLDLFDDGLQTFVLTTNNSAQTVSFEVSELTGTADLVANILIDLNIDGDWNDPGEHVVVNQQILIAGGEGVVVSNPFTTIGAVPGPTWMRITLTRSPINPGWDGTMAGFAQMIPFDYGETEDWEIVMEEGPPEPYLEFGDAPDPTHPSNLSSDGARHTPTNTECLGLQSTGKWKDYELDANVPDLDLFDDGLVTSTITVDNPAQTVTFEVSELTGTPSLIANILIDLNIDGDWDDAGEHVVVNQQVPIAGGEGTVVSNPFSTIGAVPGPTWMRITLTRSPINSGWNGTMASAGYLSPFEYGETEDWNVSIEHGTCGDVDGIPGVTTNDGWFIYMNQTYPGDPTYFVNTACADCDGPGYPGVTTNDGWFIYMNQTYPGDPTYMPTCTGC
jgi:hypothetical protein